MAAENTTETARHDSVLVRARAYHQSSSTRHDPDTMSEFRYVPDTTSRARTNRNATHIAKVRARASRDQPTSCAARKPAHVAAKRSHHSAGATSPARRATAAV